MGWTTGDGMAILVPVGKSLEEHDGVFGLHLVGMD
jgi:hypothetical protein